MKKKLGLSLLVLILALGQLQADKVKAESLSELKSTQKKVEQKSKVVKEALEALKNTNLALRALEENRTKEAEELLVKVTGKLDLLIAKDPTVAFLPIEISQKKIDVVADKEAIKIVLFDVNRALKNGQIQKARHLLKNLASEIVISTTSIPLATYPDAIKSIAPMLDKGEIDKAKEALRTTLSSLVVTDQVIPLPILRATLILNEAEKLVEDSKATKDKSEKLSMLLKEASYQLEMAELLGYGTEKKYKSIHEEIKKIKDKSTGNKSGKGWFKRLKEKISNLTQ